MVEEIRDRIVKKVIEDEMKQSYLAYAMSVIVGRALPDVRDGLKPVHRRILYAMHDMGMHHNKPFKKSARIVGEVLGKYHPHGDLAVYDSLVRMVQTFSLRYPLIDGQGNFGSVDGDSAAAMRYTEARLSKLAEEMLQDIDKQTVKFVPNFDGSLEEPSVLPCKLPNLLINGSSGIAVGMATNIPPHNLHETCDAAIALIDNTEISVEQLMEKMPAPDFPTGGIICGTGGAREAYTTGKGKILVRAKIKIEQAKNKNKIIVTEIPYQVNKAMLVEQIADLVKDKKIVGITDLRDESDKDGIRVVIELKTGINSDVVLNQLYTHTRMQETFGIIMLALVNNEPKILCLKDLLKNYVGHRQEIVRKRIEFELNEAEEKAHILEGIIVCLDNIDAVIKLVKGAKSVEDARNGLMKDYELSQKQAQAILDMKLQRLTSLEQSKVRQEHKDLLVLVQQLKEILASEQRILNIIKNELLELKQKYGDARKTEILQTGTSIMEPEELIEAEDMVVTITHAGYVKRLPVDAYKKQRRGGRGIIAAETKEEDFVEHLFVANTHDYILYFTNKGKVHWLKVHELPEAGRYAKGTAIINLLELGEGEKISAAIPIKQFSPDQYLFMITKQGIVKKTSLDEFSSPRKGGIIALGISEGDELVLVELTDGKKDVVIATRQGLAIRFSEEEVRPMGRTAYGVIGIRLRKDDFVVGGVIVEPAKTLLTVTEKGYGKRTVFDDYRRIGRGGVGVINLKITEKNGPVVGIKALSETEELMLISKDGIMLRTPSKGISEVGRATQGVRVMRLSEGDRIVSAAIVCEDNTNGDSGPGNNQ